MHTVCAILIGGTNELHRGRFWIFRAQKLSRCEGWQLSILLGLILIVREFPPFDQPSFAVLKVSLLLVRLSPSERSRPVLSPITGTPQGVAIACDPIACLSTVAGPIGAQGITSSPYGGVLRAGRIIFVASALLTRQGSTTFRHSCLNRSSLSLTLDRVLRAA